MKNIKIVDNLVKPTTSKPIELLYCLQTSYNKEKLPQWCWIDSPSYHHIDQLTRISKHSILSDEYDVFVADMKGDNDHQTFWLGRWNDGFLS